MVPEDEAVKMSWSPVSLEIARALPVTAPSTWRREVGSVVPMPMLPEDFIIKLPSAAFSTINGILLLAP